MSGRPFLSIVTPTYNRSKCFAAALDCYLAQTYPLDRREWLILDDGSEPLDEILAVALMFGPGGLAAARAEFESDEAFEITELARPFGREGRYVANEFPDHRVVLPPSPIIGARTSVRCL